MSLIFLEKQIFIVSLRVYNHNFLLVFFKGPAFNIHCFICPKSLNLVSFQLNVFDFPREANFYS